MVILYTTSICFKFKAFTETIPKSSGGITTVGASGLVD